MENSIVKNKVIKQLMLCVAMLMFSGLAVSADDKGSGAKEQTPIYKMAVIMKRLKHFPSPQGKETLQQIITNPTANDQEKTLATAMFNINHRANMDDKVKLKKIMEDEQASADVRDLASIIYRLDHRPTKADKARLKEMLK
jgi:hypothetical protein